MSRPVSTESVFRAIAHSTRRKVLQLLARREWNAGELAEQFSHSRPVISRHLRVLHEAGLITMRRRGSHLVYTATDVPLQEIYKWLASVVRTRR